MGIWNRGHAALIALIAAASSGCFIEGSAGMYGVKHAETEDTLGTSFGIAIGVYYDLGVSRVAAGVGGDIVQVDGYEDDSGTGDVAHLGGPYYGRLDLALLHLGGPFTLDATVGGFGGTGAAVVLYDAPSECIGECGDNVEIQDGRHTVKHTGASMGGYAGASLALHQPGGTGEARLTLAGSVVRTNIAPRDPLTATGVQIRFSYGFTQFGKGNAFTTLWKSGYDDERMNRSLEEDMKRHNRNQNRRNEERQERERQQERDREEQRKRRQQGLD